MQADTVLALLRAEAKASVQQGSGFICRTQESGRLLASLPADFLEMTDPEALDWMAKWGILPQQIQTVEDLLWPPHQTN